MPFTARLLRVDLTAGTTRDEEVAPEILRKLALWNRVCQIHGSAWHVRQSDLDEIWAGLSQWHRAETVTGDGFDALMGTNLRAPLLMARAFAASLPADRTGLIVNLTDQRVWRLNPQLFSYTLTKAALLTATRTLAQALAPRIRVNAVAPSIAWLPP